MKPTDEQLMAYVDGELDAADAARVEAAMAADPAVAEAVARARALGAQLREAFAPVLEDPVPPHLLALARGDAHAASAVSGTPAVPAATGATPIPLPAPALRRRWGLPEWAAMAAALVLGIAISQFGLRQAAGPITSVQGRLVAGGELAAALDSRLASDGGDEVRIGLSFRDHEGAYCRGFRLQGGTGQAGLACRDGQGQWQVPVLVGDAAPPDGGLRQASSALPAAVLAEVDARIQGEPLDAAQERAARATGWR